MADAILNDSTIHTSHNILPSIGLDYHNNNSSVYGNMQYIPVMMIRNMKVNIIIEKMLMMIMII